MQIHTFDQAVSYLESFIRPTIFARVEADKHLTDPLQRMRYLLQLLGNPQSHYPVIQVSGTSGKGSTAYLISHLLKTAGYKVGFTLSPHLEMITERMQVNNTPISKADFVQLVNELIPAASQMEKEWIGKPSYFEMLLAMALLYFKKKNVDLVVAEVGLEGKYDGTNALSPVLAVLTNISLDHTRILGDTVEKIAEEATSLIKEKKMTVITGVTQESVKEIVAEKAKKIQANVVWCTSSQIQNPEVTLQGSTFSFHSSQGVFLDLKLSLLGSYQLMNATLAIEAVLALSKKGFTVSEEAIRKGLATASFPGRFEIVIGEPTIILDGAHNPAKMAAFLHDLKILFPNQKKVFLIAFKEDKAINEMIPQISELADSIIITTFSASSDLQHHVSASVTQIAELLPQSRSIRCLPDTQRALQVAISEAKEKRALLVVTGSLYLVGEIRSLLRENKR